MATSATIRQTRTVLSNGTFQLISEIIASTGFRADVLPPHLPSTRSLFLLDADGVYEHLARVGDVENYLDGPPGNPDDPYYRVAAVTLEYDTIGEAQAASDAQKQGLSDLVTDYDAYKNAYMTIPGHPEETPYSAP